MGKEARRQFDWSGNIEHLEEKIVMSADPLGGLLGGQIQHHAIVDEMPPLTHHNAQLPPIEHHLADELPPLNNHLQREADFWLDSDNLELIDSELERIEQSLANAHDQSGMTNVRTDYGFDGTGQTVAVIDSGIAYDHFALGGGLGANYRVVGGWDFTGENDADPYDDGAAGSHGTHVAGIVGASGGTHEGVAPGVDLVGLRVFDDAGNGYFSWVENALQWVYDNRNAFENPITAVNLSLGVATYNADSIPSWANLENEFYALNQAGIFVSVSAGNSFTSFNQPGLSYPAASPHVVPVASVDDSGLLSYYSQRNSRVIAAPGRGIMSTVPDYKGNNNGIADDYASFSGTSMAAPYVAGASVIIREAMEFVGYTNITQQTIYDHMVSTADSFYDSATDAYYNRLNMDAAIDALMPTDEFGSTVASAFDFGTLSSDQSTNGVIGTLDDVDYFKFTASATGSVSFTVSNLTHDLTADWTSDTSGVWSGANNETFTIDVVAGQEYTVGFSSDDGLGYYDLDIASEASEAFTYTDWGAISFSEINNISNTGENWYRIETNNPGWFTAEAFFDGNGGQVSLELYNAAFESIDTGNPAAGTARVDGWRPAGTELYLKVTGDNSDIDFRLTNLVYISGTTVTIGGTSGNDTYTFSAGSTHNLTVNGTSYSMSDVSVTAFQFDGGAGSDSISIVGTSADETAFLRVGDLDFSSSTYSVEANQIETISIDGNGGSDTANFYDSVGDDLLVARPTSTVLTGQGFDHAASNFSRVNVYATAGGYDLAQFHDGAGDDRFIAMAHFDQAYLYGEGYLNFTSGFDRTEAYSTAGGHDRAYFYDSAGNDRFIASAQYDEAYMYGDGFLNYSNGFDRNYAFASEGGSDRAYFYDSQGNDIYSASAQLGEAYMSGDGFLNYANGFDRSYAYATEGGSDRAYFYDSLGDDRYVASAQYDEAYMYGDGYINYSKGFGRTDAFAILGGHDRAYFYDSVGDDRFVSSALLGEAYMYGDGFLNYASDFDRNYAYATAGGYKDRADFYDSAGNDEYVTNAETGEAYLVGGGYLNYANGFERNFGFANAGGSDLARFYDSLADDTYTDSGYAQRLFGNGYTNSAEGFNLVNAYGSQGFDLATIGTIQVDDAVSGSGNLAEVTRGTTDQDLYDFDKVSVTLDSSATSGIDESAVDYIYEELGA